MTQVIDVVSNVFAVVRIENPYFRGHPYSTEG